MSGEMHQPEHPMKTVYVIHREEWRQWLAEHHDSEKEIWLVYYKKNSGKPRIPYNDAVEEALCFGWIDSILRGVDEERFAQRFSPRKAGSNWSAMNKERARRLIQQGKMAPPGLAKLKGVIALSALAAKEESAGLFEVPPDILDALRQDPKTWESFSRFPESYKRIRIGWIEMGRRRPEVFQQRLRYFIRMTAQNKQFGMVR